MSGPDLHPLHAALLERWRAASSPREPRLRALLELALSGQGELLRLSPRRVVLRLQLEGEAWLLKLDAPRRPLEALRRVLRAGPARREARNADRLAAEISGAPTPALAEESLAGFGIFARPWIEGRDAATELVEQAELIGAGLARLHAAGWTDPDLTAADLILPPAGPLLPADLGHARVRRHGATSSSRRRADFVQLLASAPAARARAAAPGLLEGYSRLAPPPGKMRELLPEADQLRTRLLRRQSHRCLRECRDFRVAATSIERRDPPVGRTVEKARASASSARETFRALYELELHALRALRPDRCGPGPRITGAMPESRPATAADDEALLELGEEFLRAGFGLDLEELESFAVDEVGKAWLQNPDALLGPLQPTTRKLAPLDGAESEEIG